MVYQNVGEGKHYTTYHVNPWVHEEKNINKNNIISISYHILRSAIAILILAEAQKPRRRIGIADQKVFAAQKVFTHRSKNRLVRPLFVQKLFEYQESFWESGK